MNIKLLLEKFKRYDRIVGIGEIARRLFVLNSFDGALTSMGVMMGAFFGGVKSAKFIMVAVLGGAIAMCVSGISGAYLTEEAERERKLKELETHTLSDLKHTEIGKAQRVATFFIAFIDGFAPVSVSLVILIPFFFHKFIDTYLACILSIMISFLILLILGIYLGNISKQNIYLASVKMIFAGVICVLFNFILLK